MNRKTKVFFNEDSDHFLHFCRGMDYGKNLTEKDVTDYIDQFAHTDVSDFFFCVNSPLSAFPSKTRTFYGDKFLVKEEMGQPVDYCGTICETAYRIWVEKGMDLYRIWIDRCRKNSISPWLSFRMNDAHLHFEVPNCLIPREYFENYETLSRVRHREQMQYYDRCRDFELECVRDEWVAYITEALERYDVDGIELDFQREFDCYQIGHEQRASRLMTELVGRIKTTVMEFEKRYNHKIRVAVRCHANPMYCEELGFDILEWAKRGYFDLYIASPRWESTNTDMPIALWKKILAPYAVELAGAIELLVSNRIKRDVNSIETALGTAANILSQGADGVYTFNFFYFDLLPYMPGTEPTEENRNHLLRPEGLYRFFSAAGSLEKLQRERRRNVVAYADKPPIWRNLDEVLPLAVNKEWGNPRFLRIAPGKIAPGSRIVLRVGFAEKVDIPRDLQVFVNSEPVEFIGTEPCGTPELTDSPVLCFAVPERAAAETDFLVAEFLRNGNSAFAEITVNYADVTVLP